MAQIRTSKRFRLNWYDALKASIIAGITASATLIFELGEKWLTSPSITLDKASLIMIVKTTVVASLGYLLKQFFQASTIVLKGEDVTEAVDVIKEQEKK